MKSGTVNRVVPIEFKLHFAARLVCDQENFHKILLIFEILSLELIIQQFRNQLCETLKGL